MFCVSHLQNRSSKKRNEEKGKTFPQRTGVLSMKTARILVIDDDPIIRELVPAMLRCRSTQSQYTYHIFSAGNGEQGLDQAHVLHPDVILLDFNMPGISGG